NREILSYGVIWAFYVVDEPFWNGLPVADLETANSTVKATFPLIPTMASMNRHDIDAAPPFLPEDLLDVVGFHMYAVPEDPNIDAEYQLYLARFQAQFSGRDFVVVADAWWTPHRHGAAGLEPPSLADRARQYRQVAEDIGAIALGTFVWESFSDVTGLRDLPEEVLREYIRIGSEITRKCGVPDDLPPLAGETALFLQTCQFYATVHWRNPTTGEEGDGVAVPLTRNTGMFWFFDSSNIELTVKLLDGTSLNDHWWVFWSHMTSLDVWLEITDLETGVVATYSEPIADTLAFSDV
ncbi:MAG: hypothetical protein V3T72_05720, partial [Thermoanaerobaculia bacterium]